MNQSNGKNNRKTTTSENNHTTAFLQQHSQIETTDIDNPQNEANSTRLNHKKGAITKDHCNTH